MSNDLPVPGPKGETKFFFENKTIDILLAMMMAIGSEVSALSERLETVIDLLDARGLARPADIDGFAPSPEQQARRDAARRLLIETLLAPFQHEADALTRYEK